MLKKLALDALMLGLILVAFAYELTGSIIHELLGLALLGLFFVHGGWNWAWFRSLFKGRYSGLRSVTLLVNALLLISVVVMMVSGIVNADLLFRVTGVELDWIPREIHTASANWFLILMAVHLGLHWKLVMHEASSLLGLGEASPARRLAMSALALFVAAFGVHVSIERSLYARLIAYYSFGNWQFDESVLGFFVQYLAIVGLYASVAYYALRVARWNARRADSPCEGWLRCLCRPGRFET
ncbi:MAG: DUF4405 domain-containing protein [Brachymonas sp.]